jgi:hypothetical protein
VGCAPDCASLRGVYFKGNAPTADSSVFDGDHNATVYYLPGATGWGATFCGCPTALWNQTVQLGPVLLLSGGAVQVGVTGFAGLTYPIQVSTNLVNWDFLTNATLANVSGQFSDPAATNCNRRFYRAVAP